MSQPNAATHPVRRRWHSEALKVNVSTVWGFEATCRCGWRSKVYRLREDAVQDARLHNAYGCEPAA